MNTFPWNIFIILLAAGLLGTAMVIPYALSFNPKVVEKLKETGQQAPNAKRTPSTPVLILISTLQSVLLIGVASFVGLLAAKQVGLGTPILQAAFEGRLAADQILEMLPAVFLLGIPAGLLILGLEAAYFMPRIPRQLASLDTRTAFWKRVLACFYGGIVEEILIRLFVMSCLVWLIGLVWQAPSGAPTASAFWLANVLAALLFGAGHLPATSMTARLTPLVITRALLLNGIPGVVFGYLYMRYGLEAAMLSHFSLDILIHLIAPPIMHKRVNSLPPEPTVQPA